MNPFLLYSFWMLTLASKLTKDLKPMTVGIDLMHMAYLHISKNCRQTKALSEKMTVANTATRSLFSVAHNLSLDLWSWLHAFIKCHKKTSKSTIFFPPFDMTILFVPKKSWKWKKIAHLQLHKLIFQVDTIFHFHGGNPRFSARFWATSPSSGSTSQQREPPKAGEFLFPEFFFFEIFFTSTKRV